MFWLLFGAFMYLMIKNQWDLQGVKKDVCKIAHAVKKALMGAGKSIQAAAQEAQKQKAAKAAAELVRAEQPAEQAAPAPVPEVSPETKENNALLQDLEEHSTIAAMLANVPTLSFQEDAPKYDSYRT